MDVVVCQCLALRLLNVSVFFFIFYNPPSRFLIYCGCENLFKGIENIIQMGIFTMGLRGHIQISVVIIPIRIYNLSTLSFSLYNIHSMRSQSIEFMNFHFDSRIRNQFVRCLYRFKLLFFCGEGDFYFRMFWMVIKPLVFFNLKRLHLSL